MKDREFIKLGQMEFLTREIAMQFAKDRIEESWIVHCYPICCPNVPNKWIVNWWCQ